MNLQGPVTDIAVPRLLQVISESFSYKCPTQNGFPVKNPLPSC